MGKPSMEDILKQQLEVANTVNMALSSQVASQTSMITSLNGQIASMSAEIAGLHGTIASLNTTIDSLKDALLKKGDDMASIERRLKAYIRNSEKKSEKSRRKDAKMPGGDACGQEDDVCGSPQSEEQKVWPKTNHGARHKDHCELETIEHDVKPDDPSFDAMRARLIGTRDVERYSMAPMRFERHIYHIQSYSQEGHVLTGKTPSAPVFNSRFDSSFVAGLAYLRYIKAMPVDRIAGMFSDFGFGIDRSTASKLLSKATLILENISSCIRDVVLEDPYKTGDETFHKVLVKTSENPDGVRRGYLWDMMGMGCRLMYFFYSNGSRGEDVLLGELEGHDLSGALQSDGLGVYKKVAGKYGLLKLACLQHCRRKFYSLRGNPDADKVIGYVSGLYHEDHRHMVGVDGWTEEDHLGWRREYAPPILARLKAHLENVRSMLQKYPPKSEMQDAAGYMLNEWPGVENIFTGGLYRLDTNDIERMQRYVSLSRRNSLFFGSHKGAERGAVYYTIACSCRLNNVNLFEYLKVVLDKAAQMPNGLKPSAYRNLLPDRWENLKNG